MKADLIVIGVEYVVQIRRQHVLIPGTDTTYMERLDSLSALDLDQLPKAAVLEHGRLQGAVRLGGLKSRLDRCPGVYPGAFGSEARVSDDERLFRRLTLGERLGIIATPTEKLPRGRYRVEAHFRGQTESGGLFAPLGVADHFNPEIPEMADVDEDADDDEIDLWWETHYNGLRDPEGTLTAVVHQAGFKWLWTEDRLDRIMAEQEAEQAASRAARNERQRALLERNAARIVDKEIDRITREAVRPSDDEWETMA